MMGIRPSWGMAWGAALALALVACDDGGGAGDPTPMDQAMADGGAGDMAVAPDGAAPLPDQGADMAPPADMGPAPLRPALPTLLQRELTPVAVAQWMVASALGSDPVPGELRAGTFTLPAEGRDGHGMRWAPQVPAEDGSIPNVNSQVAWAVAPMTLDRFTHVVVQADRALDVFIDGRQMPGDVYGGNGLRAPFWVDPGEHVLAVRLLNRGRASQVQVWTTEDPIYLNPSDVTAPDWPVGSDHVQWLGVPVLNFEDTATHVVARVIENAHFEETATVHLTLPGQTVTQVAFELVPKQPFMEETEALPVTVQIEQDSWSEGIGVNLDLRVRAADQTWKRARRSFVDGSVQYYGVRPPTDPGAGPGQSLVVSLHGAGVQGINQAGSYAAKDFAWLIAPTNRRPFGFDWEDWGRLDALEAADDAMALFETNPTRTYLAGHSMGGHGTWHVGVNDPQRWAVLGPSAGWSDFWNYARDGRPTGLFARSQAYSFTLDYVENLAERAVFIIHGTADDNVPFSEGERMLAACDGVVDSLGHHWEEGAGHWWNVDPEPGADCVDWPELFELMQTRSLPDFETDFTFRSPGAWYSRPYSYVTLRSAESPLEDMRIESARAGDQITLSTQNVRSLALDGDLLTAQGIAQVVVDGEAVPVQPGEIIHGPADGKRPGVHGPINEVFYQPWCLVVADAPPQPFLTFARYLIARWNFIGNGQGCLLRMSEVTDAVRAERNLVYVGVDRAALPTGPERIEWDDLSITVDRQRFIQGMLVSVFPEGDRLSAIYTTTAFDEGILFDVLPFSSAASYPDFLVVNAGRALAMGFFGANWAFDPGASAP